MDAAAFFERFAHRQEIGRDITDTQVAVFYDNGTEVGCWREERSTTIGVGSVLSPNDADMARYWYSGVAKRQSRDAADDAGPERRWSESIPPRRHGHRR